MGQKPGKIVFGKNKPGKQEFFKIKKIVPVIFLEWDAQNFYETLEWENGSFMQPWNWYKMKICFKKYLKNAIGTLQFVVSM